MSWRTRGEYRGLSTDETAFLDRFNRSWDTKAEGRERSDAMDWRLTGLVSAVRAPEAHFAGDIDRDFIRAIIGISRFSIPKKANNNGWRIRITLHSGERFKIHFDTFEAALHLYSELEEFAQWFRNT